MTDSPDIVALLEGLKNTPSSRRYCALVDGKMHTAFDIASEALALLSASAEREARLRSALETISKQVTSDELTKALGHPPEYLNNWVDGYNGCIECARSALRDTP
jgi:hypothetical protein